MSLPQNIQNLSHESITAISNNVTYDVWTWLPPGYEESDQPFPLLFLLDADMFMGAAIDTVALMSSIGEARPASRGHQLTIRCSDCWVEFKGATVKPC